MTIKNIKQDRDRLRPNQVAQNLNSCLDELDKDSLRECKESIVASIYGLLTIYPQKPAFLDHQREDSIRYLSEFMVRIYNSDSSVKAKFNPELNIAESVELQ